MPGRFLTPWDITRNATCRFPVRKVELTEEEKRELEPIATVSIEAAIMSVRMRGGVIVSTLHKVAKDPSWFFDLQLPAAVQWEIANDYLGVDERPGTFGMDIWGDEQTVCAYPLESPTEASINKGCRSRSPLGPGPARPRTRL